MQYGFFFDTSRCTGCKTCVLACKDFHDLSVDEMYRRVFDYEGGADTWRRDANGAWHQDVFMYHVSLSCSHCSSPICVFVCPTGAMHKEGNGLVRVNKKVCIGCGYCAMACPYRAPFVSESTHTSTKCDGCYDRVEAGQAPICVEACPLRVLEFGEITDLKARHEGVISVAPMPPPSTVPNIVIGVTAAVKPVGDKTGYIANPKEV